MKFTKKDIKEIKDGAKKELVNIGREKMIKETLERNSELTKEEYAEKTAIGDAKKIGESVKQKRIQSNFYGAQVNFNLAFEDLLYSIFEQQQKTNELLQKIIDKK